MRESHTIEVKRRKKNLNKMTYKHKYIAMIGWVDQFILLLEDELSE